MTRQEHKSRAGLKARLSSYRDSNGNSMEYSGEYGGNVRHAVEFGKLDCASNIPTRNAELKQANNSAVVQLVYFVSIISHSEPNFKSRRY